MPHYLGLLAVRSKVYGLAKLSMTYGSVMGRMRPITSTALIVKGRLETAVASYVQQRKAVHGPGY